MTETMKNFWQKVKKVLNYIYEEYIKFPMYLISHPLKGFDMFKREKKAKMSVAIAFIIIAGVVRLLDIQFTGFLFNGGIEASRVNTWAQLTYIVAPVVLISLSNWSVTTLFDGKGKIKEIFMMICYSLFPLIVCNIIGIIMSTFLVENEVALYSVVLSIGSFLMCYIVFFGLIGIHEYGLTKCVLTVIATILAAVIICFILILGYDLIQKMLGFVYTIYREITLRNLI